jgi:hypothetical protein
MLFRFKVNRCAQVDVRSKGQGLGGISPLSKHRAREWDVSGSPDVTSHPAGGLRRLSLVSVGSVAPRCLSLSSIFALRPLHVIFFSGTLNSFDCVDRLVIAITDNSLDVPR